MQIEMLEIREHLKRFPPFDELPEEVTNDIARQVEVSYFQAGHDILLHGEPIQDLYFIRSGAVELYRRSGSLHNRLTEGDLFGQTGLVRNNKVRYAARAIEDTLVYRIPGHLFDSLCESHEHFAEFVEVEAPSRLKTAVTNPGPATLLMETKVHTLISRAAVTVELSTPIHEAAQHMTEQGVSSLLVIDTQAQRKGGAMVGILTDRDLRSRVVARSLPASTPVQQVMSPEPISIQTEASVFEAMLCMLRNNIHHLPVLHGQHPTGVISLPDIIRYESRSTLYLVNYIAKAQSIEELQTLIPDLHAIFIRMVNDQATSEMIGRAVSSVGRTIIQRLAEMAEQQLGSPPVPYSFMVLGSMAREEQLIVTDQDNALVLDDRFDFQLHGRYFEELARFVSDGLASCGYAYCKGGIMATNDRWRQPLKVWREYFTEWIDHPNPEKLLNCSIFFDLDSAHGDQALVSELRTLIARKADNSPRFLAAMARNALNRTPPLGFFRTFVMEKDGRQKKIINLKGRGTAPLTDLIRVHALACGSKAQNSLERLDDIAATKLIPPESLQNLRYALEFLSQVRIRFQARELQEGQTPDNYIEPEQFSSSERQHLKDAFQILSNAQNFLRYRYPGAPR